MPVPGIGLPYPPWWFKLMNVRCTHCGQENPDQYQYCASCGAPMAQGAPASGGSPAEIRAVRRAPAAPVSTSHHAEKRDVSYLLEDDEPPKSRIAPVILILSVLALGAFGWYELRPMLEGSKPAGEVATTKPPAEVPQPEVPKAAEKPPQAAPTVPTEEKPTPEPAPATETATTSPASTPATSETAPAEKAAADPDEEEEKAEAPKAEAPKPKAAPKPAPPAPKPVAKPAPKPVPPDPVKEAEAYLYGRGVPQNCDRAVSMLKALADKSNAKARSSLGSMYATGHCVSRDLPTAYRYFALVLRTDPENGVASQNLENIWKQMTPPERQAAVK